MPLAALACGLSTQGTLATFYGQGTGSASSGSGSSGAGSGSSSGGQGSYGSSSASLYDGDGGADDGAAQEYAPDAPPGTCDYAGTWASKLTIPVTWMPQGLTSIILANGSGVIEQWIRGVRTQQGTTLTDETIVCGIVLPDFQSTALAATETYGVVFPQSLFDHDPPYLPTFVVNGTVSGSMPGATYSADPAAALLGLTLPDPVTDPWPATITTEVDQDQDGNPGVTVDVATGTTASGGVYSDVPVGIPAPFEPTIRANRLYVAIRQVTSVTGTVMDCDHITGTVTIPSVDSKAEIDSHVLGCELDDGGACSSTQASFVDNTQPVFTPTGNNGTLQSARVPNDTTCGQVRAMF